MLLLCSQLEHGELLSCSPRGGDAAFARAERKSERPFSDIHVETELSALRLASWMPVIDGNDSETGGFASFAAAAARAVSPSESSHGGVQAGGTNIAGNDSGTDEDSFLAAAEDVSSDDEAEGAISSSHSGARQSPLTFIAAPEAFERLRRISPGQAAPPGSSRAVTFATGSRGPPASPVNAAEGNGRPLLLRTGSTGAAAGPRRPTAQILLAGSKTLAVALSCPPPAADICAAPSDLIPHARRPCRRRTLGRGTRSCLTCGWWPPTRRLPTHRCTTVRL